VPSSEATSILKGTVHTVQAGIHSITDAPATFHCGYCNTPLLTPTGPWQCQTCTTMNQPTDLACTKCSQSLYDNKVLCGQCGKSTSVPRTGLHDATRSTIAAIQSGAKLVWNSITGTPHAECPRCGTSVALPKTFTDTTASSVACTQCHHSFPVGGQTLSTGATSTAAVSTTTASTPAVSTSGSTSSTVPLGL
jgi:Zn finger protein HypA/HybF involved in hydrogenase expression